MRILVFGAGAVGSLLGGMLARTGHDVSLVGRGPHLSAVAARGLRIKGLWGEYNVKGADAYTSVSEIPERKKSFDLVLLSVKSYDTASAVREISPLVLEGTTVVSFQNGLGNVEIIRDAVGADRFLPGRIITGVEIRPGEVEVTVSADDLVIGALPGARPVLSPESAAQTFRLARVPARAVPDILSHIWLKAIYNCALNGPCSVLGIPYGRILETGEGRASVERIVEECYAVARSKGIPLDPPDAAGYYRLLIARLIPVTAAHYPSMLRDLERRGRTEIDAMNGAIGRMADELGIPAPENHRIADLIRQKTEDQRPETEANLCVLLFLVFCLWSSVLGL